MKKIILIENKDKKKIVYYDEYFDEFGILNQIRCWGCDTECWEEHTKGSLDLDEFKKVFMLFKGTSDNDEIVVNDIPDAAVHLSRDRYIKLSKDIVVVLHEFHIVDEDYWSTHGGFIINRDEFEAMEKLYKEAKEGTKNEGRHKKYN